MADVASVLGEARPIQHDPHPLSSFGSVSAPSIPSTIHSPMDAILHTRVAPCLHPGRDGRNTMVNSGHRRPVSCRCVVDVTGRNPSTISCPNDIAPSRTRDTTHNRNGLTNRNCNHNRMLRSRTNPHIDGPGRDARMRQRSRAGHENSRKCRWKGEFQFHFRLLNDRFVGNESLSSAASARSGRCYRAAMNCVWIGPSDPILSAGPSTRGATARRRRPRRRSSHGQG